jgi:ketosteroid isomerase-like protein
MSRSLAIYVVTLVAAAAAIGIPSCLAQRPPHRERKHIEREQIEALEKQWQTAVLSNDTLSMDKLLSEDFLGIEANGEVVTKAQQLAHMRNRQFVIDKLQTSDVKIKLVGQIVAIVTSLAHVTGLIDGDHLQGAYRYTRVYQRVPGGVWRVTSFEVTPATRLHPQPSQN